MNDQDHPLYPTYLFYRAEMSKLSQATLAFKNWLEERNLSLLADSNENMEVRHES